MVMKSRLEALFASTFLNKLDGNFESLKFNFNLIVNINIS